MKVLITCVLLTLTYFAIPSRAEDRLFSDFPLNATPGQFYYDTLSHSLYLFDGHKWAKQLFDDNQEQTFLAPAIRAGGDDEDYAADIAVDQEGNLYIVGYFQGTAMFGIQTIQAEGFRDGFIWKINNEGKHQWVKSIPSGAIEAVTIDAHGDILVAGEFSDPIILGGTTYTLKHLPQGMFDTDLFLWKINNDGEHIWAKTEGSRSFDFIGDLITDLSNNVYIVGSFLRDIQLGSTSLENLGNGDVYIWKVDSDGDHQWAVRGGGPSEEGLGWDSANSIALDEDRQSIYVTGRSNAISTVFAGAEHTFPTISSAYVWKLDTDGNHQWVVGHEAVDDGISSGHAITCDKEGNVYNTGFIIGDQIIGDTEVSSEGYINSILYIWKLNSDGQHQWVLAEGGIQFNIPSDILLDSDGSIYVSGYLTGSIADGRSFFGGHAFNNGPGSFVWKINDKGDHIWVEMARGLLSRSTGMAIDRNDNLFITGSFELSIRIGDFNLLPIVHDEKDIFVWNLGEVSTSKPILEFTSQNVDFGIVPVGDSQELIIDIQNTGTAAAEIESVEIISVLDTDQFSFTTLDDLLLTSNSLQTTIHFEPTSRGSKTALLRIHTKDSGSPYDINISGEGGQVTSLDPRHELGLKLYPNPAGREVRVSISDPSLIFDSILITSISGKRVLSLNDLKNRSVDDEYVLSVESLSPGTYVVYGVSRGKKVFIDKLIIQ